MDSLYFYFKVDQNGRRRVQIVVEQACKISCPYLFPPQKSVTVQAEKQQWKNNRQTNKHSKL